MRLLRPLLLALVLAAAGVVLVQQPGTAAKCARGETGVRAAAERADLVFTGVLVEQADGRRQNRYTFDVERIYAGQLADTPVEVVSRNNSNGLGRLRVDRPYVVFATESGATLRTDRCAGTARATAAKLERVERVLGPGSPLEPPREEEPPRAEFTRVDDTAPPEFTRLAAPGAALVLVGLLGLFVFRRRH